MNEYIFLMHNDCGPTAPEEWDEYIGGLNSLGVFQGGSSIGNGVCISRKGDARPVTEHLSGYIKIKAESIEDAKALLNGNPVYEAGGTVEIRELPRD